MDPLSITASATAFVTAIAQVIQYLQTVRHHKEDVKDFAESLADIQADLESFRSLVESICAHHALLSANPGTFATRSDREWRYDRVRIMFSPGGDAEKLGARIESFKARIKLDPNRFKRYGSALVWKMQKDRVKEEQANIVEYLRRMRTKLSDDQGEQQLLFARMLQRQEHREETREEIEILDWICKDTLDRPLHPASQLALENTSFVRSDKMYTHWHTDRYWQLNCYGRPGSGKVSACVHHLGLCAVTILSSAPVASMRPLN